MRDIPIIFSGPMIRALLEGRKTMTRRLAWRTKALKRGPNHFDRPADETIAFHITPSHWTKVKPGDRLWVRESLGRRVATTPFGTEAKNGVEEAFYATDGEDVLNEHNFNLCPWWEARGLPSIHMPRWASRLTLIVTATKIERLQAISREDAIAEGSTSRPKCNGFNSMYDGWSMDWSQVGTFSKFASGGPGPLQERDISLGDPQSAFAAYINELHGGPRWNLKPTNLWYENPEVVALTFTVHKQNIDTLPIERAA